MSLRALAWLTAALSSGILLGCTSSGLSTAPLSGGPDLLPPPGPSAAPPDLTAVPADAQVPGIDLARPESILDEVQEWGTYTSVQAADGHALPGVHHEDERLPYFVQNRARNGGKGIPYEALTDEPTQQLETPVLYFWARAAADVTVKVDFPEGIIGQWYPDATSMEPPFGLLMAIDHGSMRWDLRLDPAANPGALIGVDPSSIWAPSRQVTSTMVREPRSHELEQLLFYRGLGKFAPAVRVTQDPGDRMHIDNLSPDGLAAVFVLRQTGQGGAVVSLGALGAGQRLDLDVPAKLNPLDAFLTDARQALKDGLTASGLRDQVAQAMVDTWTRSWFKTSGLRVLYVAPRAWADRWLPTTITPAPSRFVRTLVGRIESLTPADEAAVRATITASAPRGTPLDRNKLGRFAEPRLWRALEGIVDPPEKAYATSQLKLAHEAE